MKIGLRKSTSGSTKRKALQFGFETSAFYFSPAFQDFKTTDIQPRFTLKAHERLKSRKTIQRLFKEGMSFSHAPFRIVYLEADHPMPLQAGFSVSTRNFKRAVDRNRVKRLMREAYRLQKNDLKEALHADKKSLALFFIFTQKEIPAFEDVFDKMGGALKRLEERLAQKKTNENEP